MTAEQTYGNSQIEQSGGKCLIKTERLEKSEVPGLLDGVELVSIARQARKVEEERVATNTYGPMY